MTTKHIFWKEKDLSLNQKAHVENLIVHQQIDENVFTAKLHQVMYRFEKNAQGIYERTLV